MPVCVAITEQTVRRTYALAVFTEDDVPRAVASITRGEWQPIDVDRRTEILANRQVIADGMYDGALSSEPPLDLVFGELAEDSPLYDDADAVAGLIRLAWKLTHRNELDAEDRILLNIVESAVLPLGFADDDEGPDIEPEVVYE